MKLTDQEQTVLKAIRSRGRGAVEISAVVRSVGYPKATTKKILASLADKGVVALHRHDYPTSLTPAERKLLIRRQDGRGQWHYFSAVSVREPNPRGKRVKRAASKKATKKKAAKKAGKKRNRTVIKAKRVVVLNGSKKAGKRPTSKKRAKKAAAKPRRRNKAPHISEADISKLSPKAQDQLRAQLRKVEEKERHAATPTQKKAAAKARRSFLSRLGTRLRVIGQTKKYKVSARDLSRCKRKKVKVRGRHETDALAKAQSKLGRGYDDFKVGNPRKPAKKAKKRNCVTARAPRKPGRSQKRNSGPATLALVNQTSPTARAQRREFAGDYHRDTPLRFPEGTPQGISKLGKLVKIKTELATVTPAGNHVWLCRDLQGQLHLGTTNKDGVIWDGPAENFGKVKRIEYEDVKKHLGYDRPTQFYHFMGEEDGRRPTLYADGKGGLRFRGKYHRITPEGIVN